MFFRLFAFLAVLVAVAFANPKPEPQVLTYSAGGAYPYSYPSAYSAYSPYSYAAPYSAYPYGYSSYYLR